MSLDSQINSTPRTANVIKSLQKALLSLTRPAIFFRLLIPFFLSLSVGLLILFFFWTDFIIVMTNGLLNFEGLTRTLEWMFSFLSTDVRDILGFFSGFVFVILILMLIYAITLILVSTLLVPLLIPIIRRHDYPHLKDHKNSEIGPGVVNTIQALVVFFFFFLLCFPLLFIPGLSFLIPLVLNSYLSQRVFPFDVLQNLARSHEIKKFQKDHRVQLWMLSISTGILVYIPLINFLAPSIAALSFIFYIFESISDSRKQSPGAL